MLLYFTVPEHEATCAGRAPPLACTCFRSLRKPALIGGEEVHSDPQFVSVSRFRRARCPDAIMPPTCVAAPLVYPAGCLEGALKAHLATRSKPRDPDDMERQVQQEYEAEIAAEMERASRAAASHAAAGAGM